jgi:hypothetical protein
VFQPTHKFVLEKLIVEFADLGSDAGESSEWWDVALRHRAFLAHRSKNVSVTDIQGGGV